jgi:hypothetical protein
MKRLAHAIGAVALLFAALSCEVRPIESPALATADPLLSQATVDAVVRDELTLEGNFCTRTANLLFRACGHEVLDSFFVASAKCVNVSDKKDRVACFAEARTAQSDGDALCSDQLAGRRDACAALGEGRFDPNFDPALFDDPKKPSHPNPYFPLAVGNQWEYRGGGEVDTVQVVDETKLIAGVTCLVVRDLVSRDGNLAEATDDWFGAAKDGSVWYCGEEVKEFESFVGDVPSRPELVSIDGSFKVARDRDKPGIIFQASPTLNHTYREEFSLGNAEDVTEILSTTYPSPGHDPALDELVPTALVQLLCNNDCVVTRNLSLLEPGVLERKYYARGIGVFLEVTPDTKAVNQLVSCNFDPRCGKLPSP